MHSASGCGPRLCLGLASKLWRRMFLYLKHCERRTQTGVQRFYKVPGYTDGKNTSEDGQKKREERPKTCPIGCSLEELCMALITISCKPFLYRHWSVWFGCSTPGCKHAGLQCLQCDLPFSIQLVLFKVSCFQRTLQLGQSYA